MKPREPAGASLSHETSVAVLVLSKGGSANGNITGGGGAAGTLAAGNTSFGLAAADERDVVRREEVFCATAGAARTARSNAIKNIVTRVALLIHKWRSALSKSFSKSWAASSPMARRSVPRVKPAAASWASLWPECDDSGGYDTSDSVPPSDGA